MKVNRNEQFRAIYYRYATDDDGGIEFVSEGPVGACHTAVVRNWRQQNRLGRHAAMFPEPGLEHNEVASLEVSVWWLNFLNSKFPGVIEVIDTDGELNTASNVGLLLIESDGGSDNHEYFIDLIHYEWARFIFKQANVLHAAYEFNINNEDFSPLDCFIREIMIQNVQLEVYYESISSGLMVDIDNTILMLRSDVDTRNNNDVGSAYGAVLVKSICLNNADSVKIAKDRVSEVSRYECTEDCNGFNEGEVYRGYDHPKFRDLYVMGNDENRQVRVKKSRFTKR